MKKLSLKKLKQEATDLLQRNELKMVVGGRTPCKLTLITGGVRDVVTYNSTSNDPSGDANDQCVSLITSGVADRCFYDCFHDGYGQ